MDFKHIYCQINLNILWEEGINFVITNFKFIIIKIKFIIINLIDLYYIFFISYFSKKIALFILRKVWFVYLLL